MGGGGSFFGANSSMPFENPALLTKFFANFIHDAYS